MKIISKRTFEASAQEIWLVIHVPENMPAWNPKCAECTSIKGSGEGTRFDAVFEMRGKHKKVKGELVTFSPEKELQLHYLFEESAKLGSVDEVFKIKQLDTRRCHVRHEIDFSNSTIPFWLKLLIGFLGRFGKKSGPDALDEINTLLGGQ